MIKTVFVQAFFKKLYKDKIIEFPTGETRRGLFGRDKPVIAKKKELVHVGYSDCEIDGERLAADVDKTLRTLAEDGYVLLSVTPITSKCDCPMSKYCRHDYTFWRNDTPIDAFRGGRKSYTL